MMRALWTGASGMIAQQTSLDNIANNLSNVNTTGYKKESAVFQSLLYSKLQRKTTACLIYRALIKIWNNGCDAHTWTNLTNYWLWITFLLRMSGSLFQESDASGAARLESENPVLKTSRILTIQTLCRTPKVPRRSPLQHPTNQAKTAA